MKRIWRELPITDPIERRQAPLLLVLLSLMFVTSLLRSTFFFELDQASIGASLTGVIDTISLVSPALALLLLFRGRFSAAALLTTLSILLGVVLAIAGSGLRRGGMLPLVFALPIVFTGLLLGWRSLALVCTLSCTAVIGIAVLETQNSPLVAYTPSPEFPANMASIFVVVVILLLSLLAWFRRDFHQELTVRLQTEQTLRQSEARFAIAFRASPAAMLISRLSNGCFIDVNASYERLFGYSRDELIGQIETSTSIYTYPEQRADIVDILEKQGSLRDQEFILRAKSGDLHTVLCSAEILTLGGELCVLESLVDITERKQAEALVRESQERLARIVDSAMDAIISIDPARNIIVFNPAAERIFGYPASEALGQSLDRFISAQFRDAHAHHIETFGHSGSSKRSMQSPGVLTALRADGSEFPIEATISMVTVAGQLMYTVILRDITVRKQTEQAMQRATERLHILADASRTFAEIGGDYQALLDQVARTTAEKLKAACTVRLLSDDREWLDAAALGHYNPTELADMRAREQDWRINLSDHVPAAVAARTGQSQFMPVIDRDALRTEMPPERLGVLAHFFPHSLIVVPLRLYGRSIGSLMVARAASELTAFDSEDLSLAQDLADRAALAISNAQIFQQLQAERAQLARRVAERTADLSVVNAELARAARLKDEFLASMSHELRTPLNSILGRSQALQEEIYGPLTAKQVEVLRGLEESGRHLLSLINDILDLSKIEAGKLDLQAEPLNVDLLCRMSMRMVAQTALQKQISVNMAVDSLIETIVADERRLKQILVNLLSNAVKFTPQGGKVGLEVQGNLARQAATFTVWDTGIGIAEDDLPKLFKPFVQIDSALSRQYEGTGLGLALVRRLAEAHGGSVTLESTPGQGSRFSITLPWNPAEARQPRSPNTAAINTSQPAVQNALVIEDSPTVAERIAHFLSELGAKVKIHSQASGAVEQAILLQPDLIVLDILLPGLSGWEVLRQLKAEPRTRDIPVVIVSVVDEPAHARALGAAAFLLKPVERETFIQTLREVLAADVELRIQAALVVAPQVEQTRILLAEDNEANIELLEYYLSAKGYDVMVARNGAEALVRAQEAPPHAILMDIQMPEMDGLEAIRRIRADVALRAIPIIALTALAMPGDRERCLQVGANEYLTKPVDLAKLVETIERLQQLSKGNVDGSAAGNTDTDR